MRKTTKANISLTHGARGFLERSGARSKSRFISKRLERMGSEARHARGVLTACGWDDIDTHDAIAALQGLWSTGYASPLVIAGELAGYVDDDDGEPPRDGWGDRVAQVGQTPELAHALLTLAQVVADGGRS